MNKKAEELKKLGNSFLEKGEIDKAIKYYQKALSLVPDYDEAYNNLGVAYQRKNDFPTAIANFKKAIILNPKYAATYSNLGIVSLLKGKLKEASRFFKKAIKLNPRLSEPYYNLGIVFNQQFQLQKAADSFKKALEINPQYAKAKSNLGAVLRNQGKLKEGEKAFRQTLNLISDDEAYYNLGIVLKDQGKIKEAIGCFEHVIRLNPYHQDAYANLIDQMFHLCDWSRIEELKKDLEKLTENSLKSGQRPGKTPFMSLYWDDDPRQNFLICRAWSEEIKKEVKNSAGLFSFKQPKRKRKKIRLGYLSNNFHDHPVGEILINLLRFQQKDKFEVFLYSYGYDDTRLYRSYVRNFGHRFLDIKNLSHLQAAKKIAKDEIDILVDLNGHTQGHRLEICALKPAPIQISWLGFLGTTGADFIDYLIADRVVVPKNHLSFYREKIVYLPSSYQPVFHPAVEWGKKPEKTGRSVVFSSFNNAYKIEPVMFDIWMEILKKVPNSVLWLWKNNQEMAENLKTQAKIKGVDPQRLIFGESLPLKKHLKRLGLVDIALDTRIYNGGATTSNALWTGIPVITLQGNHFASRASTSMLKAIGLEELITKNLEEYKNLAIKLATNTKTLAKIKEKIKIRHQTSPLFDIQKFTADLENSYQLIWENYLSGRKPNK